MDNTTGRIDQSGYTASPSCLKSARAEFKENYNYDLSIRFFIAEGREIVESVIGLGPANKTWKYLNGTNNDDEYISFSSKGYINLYDSRLTSKYFDVFDWIMKIREDIQRRYF